MNKQRLYPSGSPALLLMFTLLALVACPLYAEQPPLLKKPLWELGVGLIAFRQPHYLGADQGRNLLLPFPYVVYRGKKIKAEEGQVRGLLFSSQRLDIDVSLGGSLPVSSSDNRLRRGMPDLDPIAEVGPSLKWRLTDTSSTDRLQLELPVRWTHSIDGSRINEHGWISTPQVTFERRHNASRWRFSTGAVYASRQFQDYFYEVSPEFVTPERPLFKSSSGLVAYRATFSYEKRIGDFLVGAYAAYYDLSDATNLRSPLLVEEGNVSIGLRAAWILRKSSRLVTSRY